jgi:hypothetical protein
MTKNSSSEIRAKDFCETKVPESPDFEDVFKFLKNS